MPIPSDDDDDDDDDDDGDFDSIDKIIFDVVVIVINECKQNLPWHHYQCCPLQKFSYQSYN